MLDVPESSVPMSSSDFDNSGGIFRIWMFRHTEGRLLTLIETLGFDSKREQAVKSLFRQEVWNLWQEGLQPAGLENAIASLFPGESSSN